MNLVKVKSLDQVTLKGVRVEWQKVDGNVKSITMTDADGKSVTIGMPDGYSSHISVMIPEPPKMEDRWVLHGEVAGVPIKKAFETEYAANDAKGQFPHGSALEVTKATLPVDDSGAVTVGDDDIPF